jgi:hypothetical protein
MAKAERVRIEVTEADITRGIRRKPGSCPIAHAANRVISAPCSAWPTWGKAGPRLVGDYDYDLPRSAYRFMRAFDAGKPVKPFTFFAKPR